MKKYALYAVLASLFMVGEVLVDLLQPRLMEQIVDEGILGLGLGNQPNVHLVVMIGIRMILLVILGGLCGVLSGVFSNVTSENCGNDMRKDCFSRIMHFSHQQMEDFSTGSLITRITNDVNQAESLIVQLIRGIVRCLMFFIGGSYALLSLDMAFRTVLIIAFPIILIDIIFVVSKSNPLFTLVQEKLDKMNEVIQENISGARVVKAFVQEEREDARFNDSNQDLVDSQFRVMLLLSFLQPVMNIVLNIAVVAIIWIGGLQVQNGSIEPGVIMAAITYISQILSGMMMLAMIFQTVSRGVASSKRIHEVLTTEPEIKDGPATSPSDPSLVGSVEFDHAGFRYDDADRPILHDLTLSIRPGETVAIIGATGCGKTTMIDLIPRFYDVTEGSVKVDGIDVREWNKSALRERITVCLQKSEMFSTTIKENILLGRKEATEEEVREAARAAQAEDFILQQPDGYDTVVAQGGMSLSGGQRQRISIARSLLRRSEVIIFDDSTSALDLKTEAALYEALKTQYADVTKIIIAQRIASVKDADCIVVLDAGTINACGTHEELLASCSIYQDICKSQQNSDEGGAA